jgi:hypothetical protein
MGDFVAKLSKRHKPIEREYLMQMFIFVFS